MAGWNLTRGILNNNSYTDLEYWNVFNYIFSEQSKKRNTYKFGIIKSIIDNIFSCNEKNNYTISEYNLFSKFTENYWNLITKYHLKQMRKDGKSDTSKIEQIILTYCTNNNLSIFIDFNSISNKHKSFLIKKYAANVNNMF